MYIVHLLGKICKLHDSIKIIAFLIYFVSFAFLLLLCFAYGLGEVTLSNLIAAKGVLFFLFRSELYYREEKFEITE